MKTTIDIAEPLLERARCVATQRGTTVAALVEQGLSEVLAEERCSRAYTLRDASFRGGGLQPGVHGWSWEYVPRSAYEGREG